MIMPKNILLSNSIKGYEIEEVSDKYEIILCRDLNAKITGYLFTVSIRGRKELINIVKMGKLKIINDTFTPT